MRRFMVLIVSVAALGAASLAPSIADAAFPQCPAVDHDTSCQFLITVTDKGVQVAQDPSQGPYDGEDDALIGIQNSSSRAISSIPLSAENGLFGFESDGICSPGSAPVAPGCVVLFKNSSGNLTEHPGHPCPPETEACGYPPPAGEPAGVGFTSSINGYGEDGDAVTGYEGPTSWFSGIAPTNNSGVLNFSPALAPGASSYFSLESPPTGKTITVGTPTTLATTLSAAGQTGASVTAAQGTPIIDTATVGGVGAPTASGEVSYAVYKDAKCTSLAAQAGSAAVTNGVAGPSTPQTRLAPGTYYWQASYSGDVNNQGSVSLCGSETLIVAHKASLGLPSSKLCLSKRAFIVHPRAPHRVKLVHVEVLINGKLVSSGPLNHHHTFVSLRGLPKGTFKVSLITKSSTGTLYDDTRTFHTCVAGHHKKKK
jgi:hypothetical protein